MRSSRPVFFRYATAMAITSAASTPSRKVITKVCSITATQLHFDCSRGFLSGALIGIHVFRGLAAKQTPVEHPARKKHLFYRGVDRRLGQHSALREFHLKLGAPPHQQIG